MATETTKIPYVEGAAAATPAANRVVTYAKADGKMYSKDDAGTESLMSSGTAATRASLGLDTTDSPQFAALNVGAASDTTLDRASAGVLQVEGNRIFAVGGTDVPVADGGTGASTASGARTNLGLVLGTDVASLTAGVVPIAQLATGTPSGSKFIRDDGTLQVPAGGGGGLAQSFVGYDTIGGTWTATVASRQVCKKVTFAATTTVVGIDIHVRANGDNWVGLGVALLSDAAGVPDLIIGSNEGMANGILISSSAGSFPHTGRWLGLPIGKTVPAGDYWICFVTNATIWDIANDGSGSDVYWSTAAAYRVSGSHSSLAKTTGTVKYSLRATVLA